MKISFTILGECVSMKNQRIPAKVGKGASERTIWIKSRDALAYEESVMKQVPPAARQMLAGPVRATFRMYYATNRKDMDEALLLDCLQTRYQEVKGKLVELAPGEWVHAASARVVKYKGVYNNDSQVKERHTYWFLDPANPRVEVEIEPMEMQQASLIPDAVESAPAGAPASADADPF